MIKRILSIILTLVQVLTMLPQFSTPVFASEPTTHSVSTFTELKTVASSTAKTGDIVEIIAPIYVTEEIAVSSGITFTASGEGKIIRHTNFNTITQTGSGHTQTNRGSIFRIICGAGNTVTFKDIIIDGNNVEVKNPNSGVSVSGIVVYAGNLDFEDGAVLENCKISKGFNAEKPQTIYFTGNGTFTMSGGNILNNTAISGNGGGVYMNNGTFTMSGGSISGNTATNLYGGGVYMNNGTFTMSGGSISENTASGNGGGVYMNNGTFTMSGGSISENTAINLNGGGVCVEKGTFTMSGGSISNNAAEKRNGGGVYVGDHGKFTMSDGNILENKAGLGGGVFSSEIKDNRSNDNLCTLTGGNIKQNTALYGGGMFIGGKLTIAGDLIVSENTATHFGGGMSLSGDQKYTARMSGGTISNNTVTKPVEGKGGGMFWKRVLYNVRWKYIK